MRRAVGALVALGFVVGLVGTAVVASAVSFLGVGSGSPSVPSAATSSIPAAMLALYQEAAVTCPGLPWTVLAAIGTVESDNGQSNLPGVHTAANAAGAEGPMQFLPATFAAYDEPVPAGGAVPPSPYDPADAVYAAARLLCANGASGGTDIVAAVYAYNHSASYVARVLTLAQSLAGAEPAAAVGAPVTGAGAVAVAWALSQIGTPYVWGGETPGVGFDCSGLVQAAYRVAGVALRGSPRTSTTPRRSWRPASRSPRATSSSSAPGPAPSTTSASTPGSSTAPPSWSTPPTRGPTRAPRRSPPTWGRPSAACGSGRDAPVTPVSGCGTFRCVAVPLCWCGWRCCLQSLTGLDGSRSLAPPAQHGDPDRHDEEGDDRDGFFLAEAHGESLVEDPDAQDDGDGGVDHDDQRSGHAQRADLQGGLLEHGTEDCGGDQRVDGPVRQHAHGARCGEHVGRGL